MDSPKATEPEYCETVPGKWVRTARSMIRGLEFGEVQPSVHRGQTVKT